MTGNKEVDTALEHDAARKGRLGEVNQPLEGIFNMMTTVALAASTELAVGDHAVIKVQPDVAMQFINVVSEALRVARDARALMAKSAAEIPTLAPSKQMSFPFAQDTTVPLSLVGGEKK